MISVRRLSPPDTALAQKLVELFFQRQVSDAHIGRFLSDKGNILLAAEHDGELAGFLLAYRLERIKDDSRKIFLYEIEVAGRFRRRGVGSELIERIKMLALKEGADSVFGFTNRGFAGAVRFYEENGAATEGENEILFSFSI